MENLDSTVISTALPATADSFQTDPVHLSAGITSYLIMLAVFIPIIGWVADKFGTRNVFGGAMIGFLVSFIHHTHNDYRLNDFHLAFFIIGILSLLSLIENFRLSPDDGLSVRGIVKGKNSESPSI